MDATRPRLEKPVSGVTGVRAYRYEALFRDRARMQHFLNFVH
jgi:hypothetical protein